VLTHQPAGGDRSARLPAPQKNGPDVGVTVIRQPSRAIRRSRSSGSCGTLTARCVEPSWSRRRIVAEASPSISSSGVR